MVVVSRVGALHRGLGVWHQAPRRFPPEEVGGQVIGKPLLVLVVMVVGPAWEGVVIVVLS